MPGFQSFLLGILHHFVLAKLAITSIRVKLDVNQAVDMSFNNMF